MNNDTDQIQEPYEEKKIEFIMPDLQKFEKFQKTDDYKLNDKYGEFN